MAQAHTQEEVLDFLCRAGGRVSNAALLGHFRRFLRDPAAAPELQRRRDCFKRYVNSVAVVREEAQPGGGPPAKVVVLRARYRDLLGEEEAAGPPAAPGAEERDSPAEETARSPPGPARTFLAACGAEGSRSHACLGGHQTPGTGRGHRSPWGHEQSRGAPADQHLQGGRGCATVRPPGPPPSGGYCHPCPPPSGVSQQPCPPPSGVSQRPCPPPSAGNCQPCPPPSGGYCHPCPPPSGVSQRPCPPPSEVSQRPCPPPSAGSCHPCPPPSGISQRPCPPPSGVNHPPCPPPSGGYCHPCPPPSGVSHQPCPPPPGVNHQPCPPPPGVNHQPCPPPAGASHRPYPESSMDLYPPFHPSSSDTSPPAHESSKNVFPLCLPSSGSTTPPSLQSSMDLFPSLHPPSGDTFQPFPASSMDVFPLRLPSSEGISPPRLPSSSNVFPPFYPFSTDTSPPRPASSMDAYPPCLPSSEGISPPCSPPPGGISSSLSPPVAVDLCRPSSEEDWLPVYPPTYLKSPPALPGDNMESGWWGHLPVFKSIRCQLSLQDLEDFVDQATNESEDGESSSGSDSVAVDQHQEETGVDPKTRGISTKGIEETVETHWHDTHSGKLPDQPFKDNGPIGRFTVYERPTETSEVKGTAPFIKKCRTFDTDLGPAALPLAYTTQLIGKTARLRDKMSSSDDELLDLEFRKKSRRPSHIKKVSRTPVVLPAPDADAPITLLPLGGKQLTTNSGSTVQRQVLRLRLSSEVRESETRRPSSHRSSLVPLDPKEHDWVVKLAAGSWMQVYGLFTEDPQLALRRDFISGYTALHWIAKHGNCRMFQNFVSGAEKAGIKLDMNVKSGGGYTPLHLAAIHGHEKVMKLLVEKLKVRVTVRDNSGKRAWQYLCSTTTGEVWQLLGAPRGKTIFPVCALSATVTAAKSTRSRAALTNLSRKTSLAAFLKPQHHKWKASNLRGRSALSEVYSD